MTQPPGPYPTNGVPQGDGDAQNSQGDGYAQGAQPSPQSSPQYGRPAQQPSSSPAPSGFEQQYPSALSGTDFASSQPAFSPNPSGPSGQASSPFGAAGNTYAAPVTENGPGIRKLGTVLLVVSVLLLLARLAYNVTTLLGADVLARTNAGEDVEAIGMGSAAAVGLGSLAFLAIHFILGLALLVIAIITAVKAKGKPRVWAIVVAVSIPVGIVLYWIFAFISGMIAAATAGVDATGTLTAGAYQVTAGLDILRNLIAVGIAIVGSFMVRKGASNS
jgi:hypothetical protein